MSPVKPAPETDAPQEKPTSIKDLKPGMKLQGKVTRIVLCGAFVDIGLDREGLIHISQLGRRPINRVTEVLKEGDEVTVWVKKVDRKRKRVLLTMLGPPPRSLRSLKPGMVLEGKVTKLTPFGVFVDIGATREGLIHISELAPGHVDDPAEIVSVGEKVEVEVLRVDRKRRRIELSMKDLLLEALKEEQEPLPTVMELAWQRALARQREREGQRLQ
ncbi:MAG TPA: S1 RNA-binding domain-containing protein [Anaerolineae bacterium]|nr:S1 RNA-binding domain-containing protein [Anaerolineae bacterium]